MGLSSFERFQLRMNLNGNTLREEKINDARQTAEYSFSDDPSYREIVEIVDKRNISARINNFRKEGFLQPKMDIQSTITNEFDQGDLLYFDEQYWLCTMKYNVHDVYHKGEVIQANSQLKFQLPNSYKIYEKKCVLERPYATNISSGQIIQTSAKEYRVRLQLDGITKQLYLGQRFIIGTIYDNEGNEFPDVYKLEAPDQHSNAIVYEEGFLILNIVKDEYMPEVDNMEYGVANYKNPPITQDIIPHKINIVASENKNEVCIGKSSWKTFTAIPYDEFGMEITDVSNITFTWDLIFDEFQEKYIEKYNSIDENSNVVKIRCNIPKKDNEIDILLFSKFKIKCNGNSSLTSFEYGEIEVEIVSMI